MRLVDLTTKPWQLMLPGEKETSLNKMVYLPGTLDEFGVGHEDPVSYTHLTPVSYTHLTLPTNSLV